MIFIYDSRDVFGEDLKLKFHTKFLTLVFSVGLFIIFLVAYLSLEGLKSDFDDNFSKPIQTTSSLNAFQTQYMLEITAILQQQSINTTQYKRIMESWNRYIQRNNPLNNQTTHSNKTFLFLHELYQSLFLSNDFRTIQALKAQKLEIINQINLTLYAQLNAKFFWRDAILKHTQEIATAIQKIITIDLSIYKLEKRTTDNFHTATLGMLYVVTLLVFGIVISLNLIVLSFIQKFHIYLKKLIGKATEDLRYLNKELQDEVDKQVKIIREQDKIMFVQSKLAAMGEMLQNISHQWRQPLNSITLIIQALKSKTDKNLLTQEFINKQTKLALTIAQNMSETINSFSNFFKLETSFENFYIADAIHHALTLHEPIAHTLKIQIHSEIDENIQIFGNKNIIIQILLVLLNNSKDAFIEYKTPQPQCFISLYLEQQEVVIRYYDNAGGIKANIMDKIFEPYFTTKHKSSSTGIGLFMVRELLTKHLNGSIVAQNYNFILHEKTHKGALFVIKLHL